MRSIVSKQRGKLGVAAAPPSYVFTKPRVGFWMPESHHEIVQNNRVVDYAGTITPDGVYTAPSVVPDPPRVQINIMYFREGARPSHLSLIGPGIKILPQ